MSSPSMNRYWMPNWDIHKRVITQELQYYLGPQATVRPYTFEGEDGFLITTPGPCLTDEQIDDLCRKSRDYWGRQESAKRQREPSANLKRPMHRPILLSRGGDSSRRRANRRSGS